MSLKHGQYDSRRNQFLDGCHRYNWILSPIITALISALMFSHYIGGIEADIASMKADITILKQQVFELAHMTRGIVSDAEKSMSH